MKIIRQLVNQENKIISQFKYIKILCVGRKYSNQYYNK